ncbi:hypothetical protein PtoMrB4_15740 [Metapseudomonas otitidis]|uniref:Uncharacterized protein n=1 Tax=Metapseudomonas otitidis TaxID=319939 RepID=A0A679GLM2_9GAMM|nr:hypothetical protein PtoMrB4_15740 [Pseudomonas otitidis]
MAANVGWAELCEAHHCPSAGVDAVRTAHRILRTRPWCHRRSPLPPTNQGMAANVGWAELCEAHHCPGAGFDAVRTAHRILRTRCREQADTRSERKVHPAFYMGALDS